MSTTVATPTQTAVTDTTASLAVAAATGGTAPYTYQWYRSTVTGFTPGAGNLIAGATALTLEDSGLIPNTTYYYKVRAVDSASPTPSEGDSSQLAVVTAVTPLEQNQFSQVSIVGQVDMRVSPNTISAQVDAAETATLYSGQAVKMVDSADGIPKVLACTADSDNVLGFIVFSVKDRSYVAGDRVEIALKGSVMFLMPTGSIARGVRVMSDVSTVGGVTTFTGSGGENLVGWALDKGVAGQPCRIYVETPTFTVAA